MQNILPPDAGLKIQGVYHKYTINKDPSSDATVSVINKNANGKGNIYELNDNWNNIAGNTKIGFDLVTPSLGSSWGEGSIGVDGEATLSDVTIAYNYRFDPCFVPLSDPSCPNFKNALYQYLLDNNLINNEPAITDPYYNEWVKFQLEQKAEAQELKEVKAEEEEEKEEVSMEMALSVAGAAEKIADPMQQLSMMRQMASVGKLDIYYSSAMDGGTYEDTVQLRDGIIIDNYKALKNLSQDRAHRTMVRSQYNK